jgi:hypothetical protein
MTGTEILRVANLNNMEVDVNENDIVKNKSRRCGAGKRTKTPTTLLVTVGDP